MRTEIIHHLLTESEPVITGKSQTEALVYWPSDAERTRLIGYLLYGLFSAILKKEYNKNTWSNFPHPLARARGHIHWTETNLAMRSKPQDSFFDNETICLFYYVKI